MSYTRQPAHWEVDTSERHSFESAVRRALRADGEFELLDSTRSFDRLDFELGCRGKRINIEVKEKKQNYRDAWVEAAGVSETDLFIVDELSIRKVILRAPRAYLLLRDKTNSRVAVAGAIDLLTIPRARVNRSIDGGISTFKGKWLLDISDMQVEPSLEEAIAYIKRRISSEDEMWSALACHGRYAKETVPRL